jgi:hypothetical protein
MAKSKNAATVVESGAEKSKSVHTKLKQSEKIDTKDFYNVSFLKMDEEFFFKATDCFGHEIKGDEKTRIAEEMAVILYRYAESKK